MLPTACNMPDLSDLQARSPQGVFLLNQFIGAGKDFPPTMASYRRNMVRLADKAVHDYTEVSLRVWIMLTCVRPGASVRAFLPITPKSSNSVTLRK
jgi:hypothetical protein